MKKTSIILASVLSLVGLSAEDAKESAARTSDFAVDTSVKFETEHLYRGRQELKKTFAPGVKAGYKGFTGTEIYIGVDTAIGIGDPMRVRDVIWPLNSVSPRVGLSYKITDVFTADAGYIHHFYTAIPKKIMISGVLRPFTFKRHTNEVYVGVRADVLLSPSVYLFYDFDRREVALEGKIEHFFDLSKYTISGFGIDLGAKLGYDRADRPYGLTGEQGEDLGKKGYGYYGANADLVYGINDNVKARAGVAFGGNTAKRESWPNLGEDGIKGVKKNRVWFNASVDCAF